MTTGEHRRLHAYSQIMAVFETLPHEDRSELARMIQYNDAFCWYCGRDLDINERCHCENDE